MPFPTEEIPLSSMPFLQSKASPQHESPSPQHALPPSFRSPLTPLPTSFPAAAPAHRRCGLPSKCSGAREYLPQNDTKLSFAHLPPFHLLISPNPRVIIVLRSS